MSKIDPKFIVNLKGKDFVTYEGLLDLAHQMGLISIKTEFIKFVSDGICDTVIVKAVASTKDKEFHGIGDASPRSVNKMIEPHMIRMAETRAKARALRDLTNIGMTAFEELGGEEEKQGKVDEDKQALEDNSYASDKQLKFMARLMKEKGFTAESMKNYTKTAYNKEDSKSLTKKEASELIEMLNNIGK